MKKLEIACGVMLLLAAAGLSVAADQNSTGKDLYMKYNCYACHGFSGQNGSGARLVPMKLTETAFTDVVRKGRRGMPSYSEKVLPEGQLGEVYTYIKSLPDKSRPAKSVPVLEEILKEN